MPAPVPKPRLAIPGAEQRDPLAVLRLDLAQGVQRALAHVIATPVVTRRALEVLARDPAAIGSLTPEDAGAVWRSLSVLQASLGDFDAAVRAVVEAALRASAAQEDAVASLPAEVRRCVQTGLRQAGAMISASRAGFGGARPGSAS